jgi:hypothetical protein
MDKEAKDKFVKIDENFDLQTSSKVNFQIKKRKIQHKNLVNKKNANTIEKIRK